MGETSQLGLGAVSDPRGPSRPLKTKRTAGQFFVVALGSLVVLACVVGAVFVGFAWYKIDNRATFTVDSLTPQAKGAANFLIVGVDSAAGISKSNPITNQRDDSKNTDTIMVLRLDQSTGRGSLMSIPRDLYVPIAGTGATHRINWARGISKDTLVKTIKGALNIDINHYIEIDFKGFEDLVNAVDGVPVYFPKSVRDAHTGLAADAGCTTLSGGQALALVRSRYLEELGDDGQWHEDLSSDFGRIKRQQSFIRSLVKRALAAGTGDPITALQLLTSATGNIGTSSTLDNDKLVALARRFKSLGPGSLDTYSLPVDPIKVDDGQDVLQLRATEAEKTLSIFRGTTAQEQAGASSATVPKLTPQQISVKVLNGSGIAGLAKKDGDLLAAQGFKITSTGNATSSEYAATKILFAAGGEAGAAVVAEGFAGSVQQALDKTLDGSSIVIVLGKDQLAVKSAATTAAPTVSNSGGASATPTDTAVTVPAAAGAADPAASCG